MEGLVTCLVAALYAGPHLLIAYVTGQFPPTLGDLLDVHYRLHEGVIAKGDLRNPHGTQKVSPFRRIGLLESAIRVGAENASL